MSNPVADQVDPQTPGLPFPGHPRRPSYNYWHVPKGDPMRDAHVNRYEMAAGYVDGSVADLACGWGTGTAILAQSPNVKWAVGGDLDTEAIAYGVAEIEKRGIKKAGLRVVDVTTWAKPIDWIVTLETIEHLPDPEAFIRHCQSMAQRGIVVSAPFGVSNYGKKGEKRNQFHEHELQAQQVIDWFAGWYLRERLTLYTHAKRPIRVGEMLAFERRK